MALSDHEQKVLSELEKQFRAEEPQLVAVFEESPAVPALTPMRLAGASAGAVVGLVAILGGVMTKNVLFGVIGFAVLVFSLYSVFGRGEARQPALGTRTPGGRRRPKAVASAPVFGGANPARGGKKGKSSFMQRLEERWEERRGS